MSPARRTPTYSPAACPVNIAHVKAAHDDAGSEGRSLRDDVIEGLASSPKHIPTVVLYDDTGLKIYDKVTALPEYYLFNAEASILRKYSDEIVSTISTYNKHHNNHEKDDDKEEFPPLYTNNDSLSSNSLSQKWGEYSVGASNHGVNGNLGLGGDNEVVFLELGAGSLRKTALLVDALGLLLKRGLGGASYYAIDLEYAELVTTLRMLANGSDMVSTLQEPGKVLAQGICASYDEALPYISQSFAGQRKCFLWLGSSIGNFQSHEALSFMQKYVAESFESGDVLLLGIDSCRDAKKVKNAYDDPTGVTRSFILNGLKHVERILDLEPGSLDGQFEYVSQFNSEVGRHEAYVKPVKSFKINVKDDSTSHTIKFTEGELIAIEKSHKYSLPQLDSMLELSGLERIRTWNDGSGYNLIAAQKIGIHEREWSKNFGPANIPSWDDWENLWEKWNDVTVNMVPKELLHTKPIHLRHIILFYLGHIPTFLDMYLAKYMGESYTEPSSYTKIFERGIDPIVQDPEKCHDHSIVPSQDEDWPTLEGLLAYRDKVVNRLHTIYEDHKYGVIPFKRRFARILCMVFEHQAMHLETLLYMLIQISEKMNNATDTIPNWEVLRKEWNKKIEDEGDARQEVVAYGAGQVVVGHDDCEADDGDQANNTDHAYGWDNEHPQRTVEVAPFKISALPITNQDYLDFLDAVPNDEAEVPATWISTPGEAGAYGIRVLYNPGWVPFSVAAHWPVMASRDVLEKYVAWKGGRLPTQVELRRFYNDHPVLEEGRNVDFKNWHPEPAFRFNSSSDGRMTGASNGGVWEWTSTVFEAHPGYQPGKLYPGYSSDFVDGCHDIIVGGSWATAKRIAGRESFVNWYQRDYPFVFAGGRIVYPIQDN